MPSLLYVVSEDWYFMSHRLPMARAAKQAGFDVHVAANVNRYADAIRNEGFTLHDVPFVRGRVSIRLALKTVLSLRKVYRALNPNIVHHVSFLCCVLGSLAAFGSRARVVNALTGLGYTFTSDSLRAKAIQQSIAPFLRWILDRPYSALLVQNKDDQRALRDLGFKLDCIHVISGSGVDVERLRPQPEPPGPITIGFAGRLLKDKGVDALIDAHRLLRQRGLDLELRIAGLPDPANPSSVSLQQAQEWAREPGVTWLKYVDDILNLWKSAHIAVLPSHREGLPKSLLEAAACGRPLVATDVPGCREIVIPELTGLRVPVDDSQRLADAIERLATSPDLRVQYGNAAREITVKQFSANAIGEQTVKLYELILDRG